MGKAIASALVGSLSGSAGGLTFLNGPFGLQFGQKQRNVNSKSPAQLGIRQHFTQLAKRWAQSLTATQQAGWIAFAAAHQVHDALGTLITLTGVQTYVRLNGALLSVNQPIIDDAPGAVSAGAPGAITINAVGGGSPSLTVAVTVAPGANDTPAIWSSYPVTIGTNAIKNKLRLMKVFAPGTAGPYDFFTEWNLKYGILQTGKVITCKVQYTDSTTGWQGIATLDHALAT